MEKQQQQQQMIIITDTLCVCDGGQLLPEAHHGEFASWSKEESWSNDDKQTNRFFSLIEANEQTNKQTFTVALKVGAKE